MYNILKNYKYFYYSTHFCDFLSELKFLDEIVQLLKTNPGHGSHDSDEMTEEEGSGHMSHFPHNV